ncbi:unnamed protein product [Staurois parvus]|uniref:Uncharacterized protein n=1 Tax=Staurois parvus TaxID=386267 RepID=A0ABN9AXZ3_9NEOB|nr:unnamed protein product [Staurois parvus]
MRGPGRADTVNAGVRESGYSECGSGESGSCECRVSRESRYSECGVRGERI